MEFSRAEYGSQHGTGMMFGIPKRFVHREEKAYRHQI